MKPGIARAGGVAFFLAALFLAGCETPASLTKKRTRQVEKGLLRAVAIKGQKVEKLGLDSRLQFYKVPAVSLAVMDRYVLEWAKGYGVRDVRTLEPATAETLFQAGALGQLPAAAVALRLVSEGTLALDEDLGSRLRGRDIPADKFSRNAPVTLRGLLLDPSEAGIAVLQKILEDVTALPFPALMAEDVFAPLGIRASTYESVLGKDRQSSAASGHGRDGRPAEAKPGGRPSPAAAGLWTNPTDLVTFAGDIMRSAMGHRGRLLDAESSRAMLTPQAGTRSLGFIVDGSGTDMRFHLRGRTDGFTCALDIYPYRGQGAVIMTNSDNGFLLTDELLRALTAVYLWPDFKPQEKTLYRLDPSIYAQYIGRYEITPDYVLDISYEDYYLVIRPTGQAPTKFYVESSTFFFSVDPDIRIQFLTDSKGNVTGLVLWQQDFKQEARKTG
jgi:CubicO group peptidase (beta-lactamase class C family)